MYNQSTICRICLTQEDDKFIPIYDEKSTEKALEIFLISGIKVKKNSYDLEFIIH